MLDSKNVNDTRRLFFGLAVEAVGMHTLPGGRILKEEQRHATLAFLGNSSLSRMQNDLGDFPRSKRLGLAGRCDQLLFLPKKMARVVAAHIDWYDAQAFLQIYQELTGWLLKHGYPVDTRELLSHVTLARAPFHIQEWKQAFSPFPLLANSLNLYESLGNLTYRSVWSLPFLPPIEEIEHTADVAFRIRGKDIQQLFQHAQLALAFKFPDMLHYFLEGSEIQHLDDIVIQLNSVVSHAVTDEGCPFKAIRFHGNMTEESNGFLLGEMIFDKK